MTPKTDTAAVGERRADDAAELRRRLRLLELENERLQSSLDNSLVILETVKQLTGGAKRSHAVQVVLERTVALFDLADAGLIALYDEEDERLKVVACHHYDPCVLKIRMHPGEGAPGWTYTSQTPHIWAGPEECAECVDPVNPVDRALIRQAVEGRPFAQSLMCSPFLARGKVIGAIQLEHYADERHFSERELQILTNLAADPLAVALDNTALVDQLRRRNRQMRELLRRTINAQEEERERVARNLHDDVSQTLTGLLIALKNLQSVAAAAPNGAELTSYLCDVEEDVRRTIATTQDLAVDLRPALLDDIGLVSALEWYLEHRVAKAGVKTRLRVRGIDRDGLEDWSTTALFRIAQEALSNVVRHAQAENVVVSLSGGPSDIVLTVTDDGCGFATHESDELASHLGLRGMQERVQMIGGSLAVRSRPGEGTEVRAVVPLVRDGS